MTLNEDNSVIIGFQTMNEQGEVIGTKQLYDNMKLGTFSRSSIVLEYQVSGHVSNDNKQINILTGQTCCSVSYPMPCYLVKNNDLGRPPVWLQLRFLRAAVSSPSNLPEKLVRLIGDYAAMPVTSDPPMRVGDHCFKN